MEHELAEAVDEAQQKYEDEHKKESRTALGLRNAIGLAIEARKSKLNTPFTKYPAIANPLNENEFLFEIRFCPFPFAFGSIDLLLPNILELCM